jgi:hypothetical protein
MKKGLAKLNLIFKKWFLTDRITTAQIMTVKYYFRQLWLHLIMNE